MSQLTDILNGLLTVLASPVAVQLLGILALGLALWQLHQAKSQTHALAEIRSAMSTHYLGLFPVYVSEITEVVRSAKSRLQIVCDTPAYAQFSAAKDWSEYASALSRAQDAGVRVTLVCSAPERQREIRERQFAPISAKWSSWKVDNAAKLRQFLSSTFSTTSLEDLTFDAFLDILERGNERAIADVFSRATVVFVDSGMPVCCWIADGNRSIFTVTTYTDDVLEHGFRTVDGKLILALEDMHRSYLTSSPEMVEANTTRVQQQLGNPGVGAVRRSPAARDND